MELGNRLLYGQGGGRGDLQRPASSPARAAALRLRPPQRAEGEYIRDEDHHDHDGDRQRAAPHDGADREREHRGHGEQCPGAGDHPCLGEQRHRPLQVAVQQVRTDGEREDSGDQPGDETDRADHDGLGGQQRAAAGCGGQRDTDQPAPVLGGDEQRGHHDQRISPKIVPASTRWRD